MENLKKYSFKIYKTRYFWLHLAKSDLKARFRRSRLGFLWQVIQPLFLTIILSVVFSTVFNQPLGSYAIYVLSGIVVWDLLQSCVIGGGNCYINSEQYIRQYNHPITIYSLRYAVLNLVTFLMELIALVIWILFVSPENLIFAIITLPLTIFLYFPMIWGLTTISGYMSVKYRDYPQIMVLVMQMIYYVSPVFFKQEMFTTSETLVNLLEYNPITHILNLIRCPFVYMTMPSSIDYIFVICTDIIIAFCAYRVNKNNEKKVIFYL